MTHVGYGVTYNGEPVGIWPVSHASATYTAAVYKKRGDPSARVEVVSVHMGDAIAAVFVPHASEGKTA